MISQSLLTLLFTSSLLTLRKQPSNQSTNDWLHPYFGVRLAFVSSPSDRYKDKQARKELGFVDLAISNHFLTEWYRITWIILQFLTMDISVLVTMKNAAKRDRQCESQNSVNHRIFERKWRFWVSPRSMLLWVSVLNKIVCFDLTLNTKIKAETESESFNHLVWWNLFKYVTICGLSDGAW